MFVLGKDYNDISDESKKMQGVMDGAPAYQVEPYLYVVPEKGNNEDYENKESGRMIWETGDKTIEDYYALPDERRVELIDGVFYDMAAPSYVHQIIVLETWKYLNDFVEKNGGSCMPFAAPADVKLFCDSDKTMVQPDVFVVCDREQITLRQLLGAPDLVMEVVSPDSRRRDADLKLRKYRESGVREYWIIFPKEKKVLVYLFEKADGMDGMDGADGMGDIAPIEYTFADRVPVGIWDGKCKVDFAEIYERCRFLYE
ncbi:MAG: Uma2 family endonuclease [Lachnospiraceae bacterium]|nr:Uma2 family endonuclease [Lachnospiraceae bacterium]